MVTSDPIAAPRMGVGNACVGVGAALPAGSAQRIDMMLQANAVSWLSLCSQLW